MVKMTLEIERRLKHIEDMLAELAELVKTANASSVSKPCRYPESPLYIGCWLDSGHPGECQSITELVKTADASSVSRRGKP